MADSVPTIGTPGKRRSRRSSRHPQPKAAPTRWDWCTEGTTAEEEQDLQALFESEVVKPAPRNQPFIGLPKREWLRKKEVVPQRPRSESIATPEFALHHLASPVGTPDFNHQRSFRRHRMGSMRLTRRTSKFGSFGKDGSTPSVHALAPTAPRCSSLPSMPRSSAMTSSGVGRQSLTASPSEPNLLARRDTQLSKNLLFVEARSTPDSAMLKASQYNWDVSLKHAQNALARGHVDDAHQRVDRILQAAPDNTCALFLRGVVLIRLGQIARALEDYSACLKEAPTSAACFFNRGVAHACGGMLDEALSDFAQAIHLKPEEVDFRTNRAFVYRVLGDFNRAQKDYIDAKRVSDTHRERTRVIKQTQNAVKAATSLRLSTSFGSMARLFTSNPSAPAADEGQDGLSVTSETREDEDIDFPDDMVPTFKRGMFDIVGKALDKKPRLRTEVELELLAQSCRHLKCMHPLTDEELRTAWRFLRFRRCSAGQRIFEQGDPANFLVIVWTGCCAIRVLKDASKKDDFVVTIDGQKLVNEDDEVTVNIAEPGGILGELNLENPDSKRAAACVCVGPTELLVLDRRGYKRSFSMVMRRLHEDKMDVLRKLQFTNGWTEKMLFDFASSAYDYHYKPKEVVVRQGDKADALYLIKSGAAVLTRAVKDMAGVDHPAIIARLGKGDLFGEYCVLDPLRGHPCTVICEYPMSILRIERSMMGDEFFRREDDKAKLREMGLRLISDSRLLQRCLDHEQWLEDKDLIMSQKGNDVLLGKKKKDAKK